MNEHAQRIIDERKQKIDEAAKIAFAEAIDAAEQRCDKSAKHMKNQYREVFGEPFTRVINERGLER